MTNRIESSLEIPGLRDSGYSQLHIDPEHPLFGKFLDARGDFVKWKGWKAPESGEDDWDRFDDDLDTAHFVSVDKHGDIIAGLRLTPVDSIEESLSWTMLTDEMRAAALASGNVPDTEDQIVWDMTRLISGKKRLGPRLLSENIRKQYTKIRKIEQIARLYGEGYSWTVYSREQPPVWIFATEESYADVMEKYGAPITRIVSGRVDPEDDQDVVFGYIEPVELYRQISKTFIGRMAFRNFGAGSV